MNVDVLDQALALHFSADTIRRSEEIRSGLIVSYDDNGSIVDILIKGTPAWIPTSSSSGQGKISGIVMKYDQRVDALSLDASAEPYFESEEVQPGFIIDYDRNGKFKGLELLDAEQRFSHEAMDLISKQAILI